MPLDLPQTLTAGSAVLAVLVTGWSARSARRDAAVQTEGARKVSDTQNQLAEWREIAKRHDDDRETERQRRIAAEAERDEERGRRIAAQDEAQTMQRKVQEANSRVIALQGIVAGEIGLTAAVFPEIGGTIIDMRPSAEPPKVEESGS